MKEKVQKFGRALSSMVMPNISIFIAWGLITALFIPKGWLPNPTLNEIVAPMQRFLLPLLIAYSGGKMIYEHRGGIIGACFAIGIIAGTETPMFIGAMIAGPLGGYLMKKVDTLLDGHIPSGFEMLVNNFSAGILGAILACVGCLLIEPACVAITSTLSYGVNWLVEHSLLPLTSILVEPAKILFLNNALNHGIFTPLGMEQVQETGKSIFFMIEANPGPGLGLLLAYFFFGKGEVKESSLSAMIIEFFGGIHEIYFPFVLMNPITLVGVILGGMSGVFINTLFHSGLVSAASPGSIIAILGMSAKDSYLGILLSILVAAAVSFAVNAILLKVFAKEGNLQEAQAKVNASKQASKGLAPAASSFVPADLKIVFACDAGMGSSAMGAANLTKKLKAAGIDITVPHSALNEVPLDTQIIVTQNSLVERAKARCPQAKIYPIQNFMASSEYDQIIEDIQSGKHAQAESIPSSTSIDLQKVVFACDAGMGSSAMGAATLSKKLKASGLNVTVPHYALNEVPLDTQVIVTHQSLVERAKGRCPQAKIYPVMNFMGANEYDQIVHDLCGA
ncbi:PTS mannitol-specific transporter subunit IIBC [Dubosiella newyorkensis]|uniref:PTS mannitol-specific transporter subunit IIBC n=1 Tax=Dubosiella newyorkensis TaxID=1862672 RepID=UPI0023F53A16|nr:PTS mannitol-specific transporter subunit IIBC [Dubosiella newyorkensis]